MKDQDSLFGIPIDAKERIALMAEADVRELAKLQATALENLEKRYQRLLSEISRPEQENLSLKDELLIIRHRYFGKSSEKRPSDEDVKKKSATARKAGNSNDPKSLLPSMRYPELPLIERRIEWEEGKEKCCTLCQSKLSKMGNQSENSEFITVIQKTYQIFRQERQKYRCTKCHGDVQTASALPRVVQGGAFSDEIAIDVAVSKYADHIPIERYVAQAERLGLSGVHPQTLIDQTHRLADFLEPVYLNLKTSIQESDYLHADETPWKMLEGDEKQNWQLWGFFDQRNAYYEARDTRGSEVSTEFLKNCKASHLVSDAYSGYGKSASKSGILNSFCNAHARRKFIEAEINYPEAKAAIELYAELYSIERDIKGLPPPEKLKIRTERSIPVLDKLKNYLIHLNPLPKSSLGTARDYTLKHWDELTEFSRYGHLPIDNNLAERGLRGPVLGRKNYYGNHSKRGARTSQILYSIIESCKLCGVEPYAYLKSVVKNIHSEITPLTPAEYKTI